MKYKVFIFLIVINFFNAEAFSQGRFKAIIEVLDAFSNSKHPNKHYDFDHLKLRKPKVTDNYFRSKSHSSSITESKHDLELYERIKKMSSGRLSYKHTFNYVDYEINYSTKYYGFLSGKSYLPENFTEFALLASIPTYPVEYRNIFDVYDNDNFEAFKKISLPILFNPNKDVKIVRSKNHLFKDLEEISKRKPVILIGHNDKGNFMFPDGTFLSFDEIEQSIGESKHPIVFLSCNSNLYITKNYGVDIKLTYDDAVDFAHTLNEIFKNKSKNANKEFDEIYEEAAREFVKMKGLNDFFQIIKIPVTFGGILYTIYEIRFNNKPEDTNIDKCENL